MTRSVRRLLFTAAVSAIARLPCLRLSPSDRCALGLAHVTNARQHEEDGGDVMAFLMMAVTLGGKARELERPSWGEAPRGSPTGRLLASRRSSIQHSEHDGAEHDHHAQQACDPDGELDRVGVPVDRHTAAARDQLDNDGIRSKVHVRTLERVPNHLRRVV